jgi:hypothetical protein
MSLIQRSLVVLSFAGALAMMGVVPAAAAPSGWYQEGDWHQHLRGTIDRTQNDLQAAAQLEQGPKERERYRHAQERLSDFDRKLSRGHFDNGKLKDAIGALEDILDHNTLQASTRDALRADLADLQAVRDRHEH